MKRLFFLLLAILVMLPIGAQIRGNSIVVTKNSTVSLVRTRKKYGNKIMMQKKQKSISIYQKKGYLFPQ